MLIKNYQEMSIQELENEIKKTKIEISLFHNKQYSKKTVINSLYGSLLNLYNRWFSYDNGTAITTSGQLSAKFIDHILNNFFNDYFKTKDIDYIVDQDTDSCFFSLKHFVKQSGEIDQRKIVELIVSFCEKKIIPYLNECFKQFAEETRAREQKLDIKLEKISSKALFTTKKRYILNVLYDEGIFFDSPQLKITGMEAVRSSTPQICRTYLKKSISVIMNEDEKTLHKLVKEFKESFMKLPFEDISFPRGVNGMDKYKDEDEIYIKGTPIHVKGSLFFNHLIKKHKVKNVQFIQNGDKIKFAYLKPSNPLHENVIASTGTLPTEFGLEKYIDYNMQFKKTYLEPLQNITRIIRWTTEPTVFLSEFYKEE